MKIVNRVLFQSSSSPFIGTGQATSDLFFSRSKHCTTARLRAGVVWDAVRLFNGAQKHYPQNTSERHKRMTGSFVAPLLRQMALLCIVGVGTTQSRALSLATLVMLHKMFTS